MNESMSNVLDLVFDEVQKEEPNLTDEATILRVIRLNLIAMVQSLAELGVTGAGLENAGLFGLTSGVAEMVEWMLSKELAAEITSVEDFEDK